jgi:hypothetical protein
MGNVYMAKIKDKSMMLKKSVEHHTVRDGIQSLVFCHSNDKDKKILENYTSSVTNQDLEELKSHSVIDLKPMMQAKLYVLTKFLFCFKKFNQDKLYKLYHKGLDKIEDATDI